MRLKHLFIFDIETIPDTTSVANLTGLKSDDKTELRQTLREYHLETTGGNNAFLRQTFHNIVAISFVIFEISYEDTYEVYKLKEIRSGGDLKSTEKDLIQGFFQTLEKLEARLVSFNGRTFDMPVLKYRAMKYGISSAFYHRSGDKWSNYSNRYSYEWHCDLLEALSDYGASAKIKLNEVCSVFGFPGKIGVEGSLVTELFDRGELLKIRNYCETDVLNTALVYLRYALHTSRITINTYNSAIRDILKFIEKNTQLVHLQEFKTEWLNASNNNLFF